MFKVKPINWGGETPFGLTLFGLGNPGGDIKRKSKRILGEEVDNRVSNDNADKYLKMEKMRTGQRCSAGPTSSTEESGITMGA